MPTSSASCAFEMRPVRASTAKIARSVGLRGAGRVFGVTPALASVIRRFYDRFLFGRVFYGSIDTLPRFLRA